jgi:predicted HTH transcriptional regulator
MPVPGGALDPRAFYNSLDSIDAVARLIDPPLHESQTLEYKAAGKPFNDDDRADIAKAVCALANSSGGVIVYGIMTARDDRTKPTGFSGFDVRNVELFDQTVATRIQKPVVGLERKVLAAENATVLVVFVPKSVYSPHQDTLACRYYYRAGSVSRPMQHDLIELHFGWSAPQSSDREELRVVAAR